MADSTNPFAGLLGVTTAKEDGHDAAINDMIEKVFYITIDDKATERASNSGIQLVYLEELAQALKPKVNIDLQILENALFERLLLVDVESCVIPKTIKVYKPHVVQKQVFLYLLSSLQKLESYETDDSPFIKTAIQRMKRLIYMNAVTALKQPGLYEEQNLSLQLFELLKCDSPDSHKFFEDVINELAEDEGFYGQVIQLPETIKEMLKSVLHYIHGEISQSTLVNLPLYILPSIKLFAGNSHLAPLLMDVCEPRQPIRGRIYELTIIGGLLSLSVLPKSETAPHLYFLNPLDLAEVEMTETSLCSAASHLANEIHSIFLKLLKNSPEIKDRLLRWIGNCLTTNSARGRLWNVAAHSVLSNYVSDGFMVNLTAVLLHLCQPFCSLPKSKVASLKIDPTYPAVPIEECASKSVHLDSLQNETCLLPPREDLTRRPTADTYNFVTECFFMTHKCIDIGLRICRDKLESAAVDARRLQNSLETDANKDLLVAAATRFTTLRCAMKEDDLVRNLMRLQSTTCYWLTQVALRGGSSSPVPAPTPAPATTPAPASAPASRSYAPLAPVPVRLPVTTPPPDELRCIPEFIFENLKLTLVLLRVLSLVKRLGAELADLLPDIFTCVLIFMSDSGWINNPHLRASLADCLEEMLPVHPSDDDKNFDVQMARTIREKLFREHPHRLQVVPSLLELFVSIEITGQSVFEHKFNYRRPMYIVMDYLWTLDEHKDEFARLAREAECNMEAVHPPIFLRFVNLLMNDAIFLLDEALGNMAQLRTMEIEEQSGAWAALPAGERQQRAESRAHVALQVRFQNMLGRDTAGTLQRLTAHAPSLFCHATLVDRIASMLNYFLAHLVGPNKKNFKVRNMSEYHFDPANTVLQICRMYVQLGQNERFCAAVSNDGRSYSAALFSSAEDVLARIGGGSLISDLQDVARRVARLAARRRRDEEVLANAPDDFLDPIMSTLMLDPVILPSSRATVDRTTIARHLLSDQSDPFNRSPLSMDQVTSNTELKQRIHAWIEEKRANSAQNETN